MAKRQKKISGFSAKHLKKIKGYSGKSSAASGKKSAVKA